MLREFTATRRKLQTNSLPLSNQSFPKTRNHIPGLFKDLNLQLLYSSCFKYSENKSIQSIGLVLKSTHTHNRLMAFVQDYPDGPFAQHPSWSSDILYQLPPFTAIHSILFVQFTCLTVLFDNFSPGPLWSSSWSWTVYFILHGTEKN